MIKCNFKKYCIKKYTIQQIFELMNKSTDGVRVRFFKKYYKQ